MKQHNLGLLLSNLNLNSVEFIIIKIDVFIIIKNDRPLTKLINVFVEFENLYRASVKALIVDIGIDGRHDDFVLE